MSRSNIPGKFPQEIWDGLTPTTPDYNTEAAPDIDFGARYRAEIRALETTLASYQTILNYIQALGVGNSILGVRADGNLLEWKSLIAGAGILLTHAVGAINVAISTAYQNTIDYIQSLGGANSILGTKGDGTTLEWKSLTAGTGILLTHSVGGIDIATTSAASYGKWYYLDDTPSDIVPYMSATITPDVITGEDIDTVTVKASLGEVLIDQYITDAPQPGTTLIPAGVWKFNDYCKVSATSGATQIVHRVFKRNAAGVETPLFDVSTADIEFTSVTLVETLTAQTAIILVPTDRLLFRYYAKTTHSSNIVVSLYHNGTTHYSFIETPAATVTDIAVIPITNTLYVDNKRTDSYTPIGSFAWPFKTIQDAMDEVVGAAGDNEFEIKILKGAPYAEDIVYDKDFCTLMGETYTELTGNMTLTTPNAYISHLSMVGDLTCNQPNTFTVTLDRCNILGGTWTINASASAGNESLTIRDGRFKADLIVSNLGDGIYWYEAGICEDATITLSNCADVYATGLTFLNCDINLTHNTVASLSICASDGSTICNLQSGSVLTTDAVTEGYITIIESGGTLIHTTVSDHVLNNSNVDGNTVTDAFNDLDVIVEISGTAGEIMNAGHAVYVNPADGKIYKTSANTVVTSQVSGFCKEDTANTAPCVYIPFGGLELANWTLATGGANLTVGAKYFLSNAAGQITVTPPVTGVVLQVATAATETKLNINRQIQILL